MIASFLLLFVYGCIFSFGIFLSCYIPATLLFGKRVSYFASFFEKITVCIIVGIVLWVLQAMIVGYLGIRWVTYVYLLVCFFFWLKKQKNLKKRLIKIKTFHWKKKDFLILTIIFLIGIFGQVQSFFITGIMLPEGVFVFSGSAEDGFWHTSLIAQLVRRFPPFEPGMVGVYVHNYHYLSNLFVAELIRIFHLPLFPTQYIYTYLFASFLLGAAAYTLAKILKFSTIGVILFVYLQYFSSDIMYLLTLITAKKAEFTVHPLEDGTMFLENPPRALSIIIALIAVGLLYLWLKKKDIRLGILVGLMGGSLIGFKVNTGVLFLSGLSLLGIYFFIKRQWGMFFIPVFTVALSLIIYLPVNSGAGLPIFVPFDMARMFAGQDKLHISHFELARQIYHAHNNVLQELRMHLTMLVLFLLAEFGVRNIGWIPMKSFIRQYGKSFFVFLYTGIIVTVFFGTFFLQPVAGADIFNFYLAASLFLSISAAYTISSVIKRVSLWLKVGIIILILICTIPRWIYKTSSFTSYFSSLNKPVIVKEELDALTYIKESSKKDAVIVVANKGRWDSVFSYVSALSQRDMFLSGQVMMSRHGISINKREKIVNEIFTSESKEEVQNLLKQHTISYLYFYANQPLTGGLKKATLKKVFHNSAITIYYNNTL